MNNADKIEKISFHFAEIMKTLGLDINDQSLKDTPNRVAKMYVNELYNGLHTEKPYKTTTFENDFDYQNMLIEKNISVFSACEHHFMPMFGKAHVAYIPNGKVIGLSKINRIVDYYARRPQVQERLTINIADAISEALNCDDVAVMIDCVHLCVAARGARDTSSSTITFDFRGKFKEESVKNDFLRSLPN